MADTAVAPTRVLPALEPRPTPLLFLLQLPAALDEREDRRRYLVVGLRDVAHDRAVGTILDHLDLHLAVRLLHCRGEILCLFAQTADGPEAEIFPKSDTEFFSKLGGQITFVKDSSGKVVKIIGYGDGSDLVAPRVNNVVEAKVNPAVYESLVGKYDYRNGAVLTVTRRRERP